MANIGPGLEKRRKLIADLTQKVMEVLKEDTHPMGVSVLSEVLANVFISLDSHPSFENSELNSTVNKYCSDKIIKAIPSIVMLHAYCVENNYTRDNLWRWGSGDRKMGFIPCEDEEKKVLYFNNQHLDFVCVIRHKYNDEIHIRQAHPDLFSSEHYDHGFYSLGSHNTVDDLREAIKGEKGLEIALANLSSRYTTWSDVIEGNQYPSYITLENMIKYDFGKGCRAFETYSRSDESYILSSGGLGNVHFKNIENASYVFEEVTDCVMSVPDSYVLNYNRIKTINDIIEEE